MSTPRQAPELSARVARARAVRALYEAVHAFAWKALEPYRLSDADRQDLAQNVMIAACERWETYRAERGAPAAWLWGIVRNEARAFGRLRARRLEVGADELVEARSEGPTPEELVSVNDLAEHLLGSVRVEERRVVILHEMLGLTFRDIARLEGISPTKAHGLHQAGMEALQAAVARWKRTQQQRGVLPLPLFSMVALLDPLRGAAGPPPGMAESAWGHLATIGGLGDPDRPESASFERGSREPSPVEDGMGPPSSGPMRSRSWWRGAIGPIAGTLVGGLVGSVGLGRCNARALEEHPATMAAVGASASAPEASPVASSIVTRSASVTLPPPPPPVDIPPPRRERPRQDEAAREAERDAERALIDRARAALASEKLEAGLDALAEHARRFPGGRHLATRERLWADACAHLAHLAHLSDRSGPSPPSDARCAGRP